ncbi:MAG: hypothetical protein QOE11_3024 [Solirubrobacteraceae bacterium]|nr:hypothetical protein [Solirubrobacteraceae bacterium]
MRAGSIASAPGIGGVTASAPVATTSSSKGSSDSWPLPARTVSLRAARSIATTSQRMRTSIPRARCSSGLRLMSRSGSVTAPLTTYGMPQAE